MTKTVFRVLGVVAFLIVGGAASAADSTAIQWKVSDGGNGHWYSATIVPNGVKWERARDLASSAGGALSSLESVSERNFVFDVFSISKMPATFIDQFTSSGQYFGPWIGGYQEPNSNEPNGGWRWLSGDSFNPENTYCCNNSCGFSNEDKLCLYSHEVMGWNDLPSIVECGNQPISFLIEYSADCNGDGVVDYGQIQSGELADTNHNNIPDVCEIHVTYVQPISGPASGGTAVNINGVNFPNSVSVLFAGVAATDVVVVSPTLISAVTPVGVPGMTVVTVNGVGGEAFYYRSNCQSDLDGSGGVDSSDLGILLLDFGSCGDSAAVAPQQPEPMIFQTTETPTPVLNKK